MLTFTPDTAVKLGHSLMAQGATLEAEHVAAASLGSDAENAAAAIAARLLHIDCLTRLGRLDESQRALGAAAQMASRWGDKRSLADLLTTQTELYLIQGNFIGASALVASILGGLDASDEARSRLGIVNAWCAINQGNAREAKVCALIASEMGDERGVARAIEARAILGWVEQARGDAAAAREHLRRAAIAAHYLSDDFHRARSFALLASLADRCDRSARADFYRQTSLRAWPSGRERAAIDHGPWWWVLPVRSFLRAPA